MNLVLLFPEEVQGDHATLRGRRAAHVLGQLGKSPGGYVQTGVLEQSIGRARIVACEPDAPAVTLELVEQVPARAPTTRLLLAIPRPKALSRLIQHAAAFGIERVDLVRTAKVEASYLDSSRLDAQRMAEDALLGLEQGCLIHRPVFSVSRSLGQVLTGDQTLPQPEARLLLHPLAHAWMTDRIASDSDLPVRIAIGPDGGFIAKELALLEASGFQPVTLGAGVLRTEAAVCAALAQLSLCQRLPSPLLRP